MTPLLVNEVFRSIQGEGFFTGTPSVFVRLQGCDVRCPWCDTLYAMDARPEKKLEPNSLLLLSKDSEDPRYTEADPVWLADLIASDPSPVRHVVITGGEPFQQEILPFIKALEERGFMAAVETSGSRPFLCTEDTWITMSPKRRKPPLEENWARASEIKLPVENEDDIALFLPWLQKLPPERVRLQPVSQKREATKICIETCMARNWRLSLQTHKYIDVR